MGFNPVIPVGNLVEYSRGGGWGKETPFEGSSRVAIIRGADFPSVAQGSYGGLPVRYETDSKVNSVALRAGDIVLENSGGTDSRPTGRTVFVTNELIDAYDCPVIPASFCRLLRFDNRANSEFVYYWLQEMYSAGRTWGYQNRSTGLSNFQYKVFADSELLPDLPIEVQSKIASVLSAFEKKIRENNRQNDYLAELGDALFNRECPQSNEPNAILSDIAQVTMGQSPSGSSYNEDGNGEVFYQGRAEFGAFFPRRRLFTTEPKRMAREGDTLMSVRAPVGDLNIANEDCCIGRGLAAIHSENNQSFVHYLVRAQGRQLDTFNGDGTVFGSINGKALKKLPVYLPSSDVIARLESRLEPIDALIRRNDDEMQVLERMRDTLLPRLMSGEIDVSKVDLTQPNNHLYAD